MPVGSREYILVKKYNKSIPFVFYASIWSRNFLPSTLEAINWLKSYLQQQIYRQGPAISQQPFQTLRIT